MNIDINALYVPVFSTRCRYIHLWGGRGRGASHFATDYFLFKMTQPHYFRGVMLRATMAQIKKSLWKALEARIKTAVAAGYLNEYDLKVNISEHTVTYLPNGNSILCHGFRKTTTASAADMKGIEGCTHAIVEEAEDVYEMDFKELSSSLRTTLVKNIQILVLFNPPGKNHWLIKNNYDLVSLPNYPGWYKAIQKPGTEDVLLSIHSTYLDNTANLNAANIREYENYGNKQHPSYDPDYFYRSVKGLISEGKRGRIFLKVKKIRRELYDELPFEEFMGLDFGFNAPTAVTGNKFHNGKLYSRQIIYQEDMDAGELAKELKRKDIDDKPKIYADPAEPASIKTLRKRGFNVLEALKGADSIEYGYRELKAVEWYITDDSTAFWEEIEEHIWELDAEKNPTDTPEDDHNHAIDATRYAYTMHVARKGGKAGINTETGSSDGSNRERKIDALVDTVAEDFASWNEALDEDSIERLYQVLYSD